MSLYNSIVNTQIFTGSPVQAFTDAYNKATDSIKSSIESNSSLLDSIKNLKNTSIVDYSKITKITKTILNVSATIDSDTCTINIKSPIISKFIAADKKEMVAGIVENIGNKLAKTKVFVSESVVTSLDFLLDREEALGQGIHPVVADELTSEEEFDSFSEEYSSGVSSLFDDNNDTHDGHFSVSHQASDEESMNVATDYEESNHEQSNYDESDYDNDLASEQSDSDESNCQQFNCNEYFNELVYMSPQLDGNYGTSSSESYYDSDSEQLQYHNMCYEKIAFEESTYEESYYEESYYKNSDLESAYYNKEPCLLKSATKETKQEVFESDTNDSDHNEAESIETKQRVIKPPVFKLVVVKPRFLELLTEIEKTTDIKKVIIKEFNKLIIKRKAESNLVKPVEYKAVECKPIEYKPPGFKLVVVKPRFLELLTEIEKTTDIKKVIIKEFNKLIIKRKAESNSVKPVEVKPIEYKPIEYKPIEYKPIEYKPPVFKLVVVKPRFLELLTEIEKTTDIKKVIIKEFNKLIIKRKAESNLVKPVEYKPIEYKPIEYKPPVFKLVVVKPRFLELLTEIEKTTDIKKVILEEFEKLKKIHPIFKINEKVKPVIAIPDRKEKPKVVNTRYIWLRIHQILSAKTSGSAQKLQLFRLSECQVENDDINFKKKLNSVKYWNYGTKKREIHYEEENTPKNNLKTRNLKKLKTRKHKQIQT